ncbi:MFS transporter [Roseivirga sp. BDSF3-8]|uniref:MFS transporter n=1 Tax=Roseivirga sp. BDSF3-8 TaxID=3241598 RepID=UPI0035323601
MLREKQVRRGLKENWRQFTLLVVINAFVGAMVGLERTLLPLIAEADYGVAAGTAVLSFIGVFGVAKALTNYMAGTWANALGRKRLLVWGWLFGLPVPLLLIYAPHWHWVVAANVLLGINQGLAWSSTVVMKIDLAGEKDRGLAMGLNESAGYLAVGAVAFLSGWIASEYGLRPYPFYLGLGFALTGLLSSIFFVKDTAAHVKQEAESTGMARLKEVFWDTTWRNRNLGAVTQAGLVNNLNDGMVWGLLPLLLTAKGFTLAETAQVVAFYPAVWGLGQLVTGKLADIYPKKRLLFMGMLLQGLTLLAMAFAQSYLAFVLLSTLLGAGTAVVYPTFLAAIAAHSHPAQRAKSIGIFRLWRDLGYAAGALITGLVATWLGLSASMGAIAVLTMASGGIIWLRMKNG